MNGREEKTSPLRLAWDLAMPCRADVVYTLRDFCRRSAVSRHGADPGHRRRGPA